jgi:hypothetical protein
MAKKNKCCKCHNEVKDSDAKKGNSGKLYCGDCFRRGELLEALDDLPCPGGSEDYPAPCGGRCAGDDYY